MKIYTKTGDDGTTALFDGTRVRKDNARVDLYGEVDELNAGIGLAASLAGDKTLGEKLQHTQKNLFALGSKLANPKERKQKDKADFGEDKIAWLENEIDEMEKAHAPMKNFILPGGSSAAAALHLARTVCRRAERKLVSIAASEHIDALYIRYLNRLSDYLFVTARHANFLEKRQDIPW